MKNEFIQINKSCRKEYIKKFISSIIVRVSYLAIPIFYSYAIEKITDKNYNSSIFLLIFLLVNVIIYYLSCIYNDKQYEVLYDKLYKKITNLGLKYTEKNSIYSLSRIPYNDYAHTMTDDINVIAEAYGNIPMAIAGIFEVIFIFLYFFTANIIVGILLSLTSLFVIYILKKGNEETNYINSQDKVNHVNRMGVLQEYYFGMKEVKGLKIFPAINKRIEKNTTSYLKWHTNYGYNKVKVNNISLGIIELSKVISLFLGVYLVSENKISLAVVLLIYSYFDKIIAAVTRLLDFNDKLQNSKVCMDDLLKLEEYSTDLSINVNDYTISRGIIDFKNVLYGPKNDPILNDFTCHIPSRGITVITGRTGSGKTGIIDLLLKLNRQHFGSIEIDKVDINSYQENIYFDSVAAVRKNPTFFHVSIRDNLKIIEKNFEKIVEICKELNIHDDIMMLPNGYDTILNENASNISNDLKYMLSIARVVLKRPKVLLFDETLNAFPKEIDLKILDYFKETKGRHSVVIISKEKHVLEEADHVLYLEKGKNIVFGKHDSIINSSKKYKEYFEEL